MSSRIPEAADPFEEEGLASQDEDTAQRITGDVGDEMAVPGEEPLVVDDYGTTAAEEAAGEPLDLRLSRELPDVTDEGDADESETADTPYPADPDERVGRIVETDEGVRTDDETDAVAYDVGTDRGGFSAEERAMHIEPEA